MPKCHLKVTGVDARNHGQTEYEYNHQTACGYVRDNVTTNKVKVDCFYCKRSEEMKAV
jgi:hypothetical protein